MLCNLELRNINVDPKILDESAGHCEHIDEWHAEP